MSLFGDLAGKIGSGVPGAPGLAGQLQTALRGNTPGTLGVNQAAYPVWKLEIWDDAGPKMDPADEFRFRWPPSVFNDARPWRSDVNLDLARRVAISHLSAGISRLTIQGSHGAGAQADAVSGYDFRNALWALFQRYEGQVLEAQAAGKTLPRLVLAARGGRHPEKYMLEYWVWPTGYPADERTAQRPLDWPYTMTFLNLGKASRVPEGAGAVVEVSVEGAGESFLEKLGKVLGKLGKAVALGKKAFKDVKALVKAARQLRQAVEGGFQKMRDAVRAVKDLAQEAKREVDFRPHSSRVKGLLREMRRDLLALAGKGQMALSAAGLKDGARSAAVGALPGGVQSFAASRGGFHAWKALATANKLKYPFTPAGPVKV